MRQERTGNFGYTSETTITPHACEKPELGGCPGAIEPARNEALYSFKIA